MNDRMLSDEILLGLIKANSGGGGGGTTDYDDLSNKPQIAGTTLSGNKSLADLGIASASDVETALDRKQDVLLYGGANPSTGADGDMYVKLVRDESTLIDMFGSPSAESTDDYEMSYAVDSSVMGDYYDYEAFGTGKGFGQNGRGSMTITYHFKNSKFKPVNVSYCNNFSLSGGGYLESANFTIKASNDGTNWDTLYSTSSSCPRDTSVSADITANTYYSYFKFEMNSGGGYTGIRNIVMNGISESYSNIDNIYFKNDGTWLKDSFAHKSEIDAIKDGTSIDSFADVETALTGKQDTLTFDDTPTDNSNNPVKSNGIYDALALKQNATDNNLETEAKTIVGAINENANDISSLESGLTTLDNEVNGDATTYPYADVITIEDAIPANVADCKVKIEPVQDLHGQSAPYVGGAGKNKLPLTTAKLKADNVNGTWNGNVYSYRGIDYTITEDNGGNVIEIDVNGTSNADFATLSLNNASITQGSYKLNGISDGSQTGLRFDLEGIGDYKTLSNGELSVDASTDAEYRFSVTIRTSGTTVNHHKVYPMIRLASVSDDTWEPWSNICPISGHTEASVAQFKKNILPNKKAAIDNRNILIGQTDSTKYEIILKANKTYTISNNLNRPCYYREENGTEDINCNGTFTVDHDCKVKIWVYLLNTQSIDDLTWWQLEEGSTATPYEPYAGKTYTIALGDTIYGGTVDFDSGVMTVDRAILDLSTISDWSVLTDGRLTSNRIQSVVKAPDQTEVNVLCETYKPCSSRSLADDSTLIGIGINSGKLIVVRTPDGNAPQGGKLCYELATPTTIQLTPQQIQLLKGVNTITASTGDISIVVNGVSGAIGSLQTQANATDEALAELADKLPTAPTTDGAYVLTVTVADGAPTYSWESAT